MAEPFEAGVRNQRIEFIRESTEGTTPSNPAWSAYSDTINGWWDWEPDANVEGDRTAGDPDVNEWYSGSETHDATITYRLQRWLVDGSGNAQDAAADAMLLDSDNSINNTHSVLSREEHNSGGNDSAGRRIYHVGKGGHPSNVVLPFETDSGAPVQVELSYQFEKFRSYVIHQPSSSTTVDITNNGSSSVDVTVEDEGASTAETNTVASGATVTTTASFGDIDAVELSTDVDGDVTVTDGSGTTFMTINGSQNYPTAGDLGVPALGSGSHASAVGSSYVQFIDDSYQYNSSDIAAEIISGELEVDMNLEDNSRLTNARRNIHVTGRTATWSATVAGSQEGVDQVSNYLTQTENDIDWTADEGTVTGSNAVYQSPGTHDEEPMQGKHERTLEFESQGVTIS